MKNMLKRIFVVLLVVLVATFTVSSAVELTATWKWKPSVPGVEYFRYQLNREIPGNWNVVPKEVTSFTAERLDGSVDNVLFLQQSFDGINWSESAADVIPGVSSEELLARAEAEEKANNINPDDTKVVIEVPSDNNSNNTEVVLATNPGSSVEDVVAAIQDGTLSDTLNAEEPVEVVEEAPVQVVAEVETPAVVAAEEAKAKVVVEEDYYDYYRLNDYFTTISFGAQSQVFSKADADFAKKLGDNTAYTMNAYLPYAPGLFFDVAFKNMGGGFGNYSGIGLRLGFNYQLQLKDTTNYTDQWQAHNAKFWEYDAYHAYEGNLAFEYNLNFSEGFGLDFYLGGFAAVNLALDRSNKSSVEVYAGDTTILPLSLSFGPLAGVQFNMYFTRVFGINAAIEYRYEWAYAHELLAKVGFIFRT